MGQEETTLDFEGFTQITATELRAKTRDILERARFQGEKFVVSTHGKEMVVVMGITQMDTFAIPNSGDRLQSSSQ